MALNGALDVYILLLLFSNGKDKSWRLVSHLCYLFLRMSFNPLVFKPFASPGIPPHEIERHTSIDD